MEHKKLIVILKSLNKEELRDFEKFISSPFFTTGRNVQPLFRYLKKIHPQYTQEKLELNLIHKKIYPRKKFSAPALKMQFSALDKYSRQFLHLRNYLNNTDSVTIHLLRELNNKNLDSLFEREVKQFEDEKKTNKFDVDLISNLLNLSTLKLSQIDNTGDYTQLPDLNAEKGEYISTHFLISLLKNVQDNIVVMNSFIIKNQNILSIELFKLIDFEKLFEVFLEFKPLGYELIMFYYFRLKFHYSGGDYSYFEKAKNIAMDSLEKYSKKEVHDMLINLSNCCWWQIKIGNTRYREELFGIYQYWITSPYLLQYELYISVQQFKNIFNLALSIGELKWGEDFLNNYSQFLNPKYSKDIISYSYAQLYFEKKQFDKSLEMLNNTDYIDYVYKMDSQSLMMRIYFETNSIEQLLSLADSLKHFIYKHKENNVLMSNRFSNFIKSIVMLAKLKSSFDYNDHIVLEKFLDEEKILPAREWLIAKCREMNTK